MLLFSTTRYRRRRSLCSSITLWVAISVCVFIYHNINRGDVGMSVPTTTTAHPPHLPAVASPCWYEAYDTHHYLTTTNHGYFDPTSNSWADKHAADFGGVWRSLASSISSPNRSGEELMFRCLPSIYIVGAAKCATTDLFLRLSRHPLVSGVVSKETHWWSHLRLGNDPLGAPWSHQRKVTFREYLDVLWPNTMDVARHPSTHILEASTHYLTSAHLERTGHLRTTAADIAQASPHVKVIICVRDPVRRALSSYLFFSDMFGEPTSPDLFHQTMSRAVIRLQTCLQAQGEVSARKLNQVPLHLLRYCVHVMTSGAKDTRSNLHLTTGFYSLFYRDWTAVFPPHEILVINTDDVDTELKRREKLPDVFKFLNLTASHRLVKLMANLKPALTRNSSRLTILPETRLMLAHVYGWTNSDLANLTQNKKYLEWNKL